MLVEMKDSWLAKNCRSWVFSQLQQPSRVKQGAPSLIVQNRGCPRKARMHRNVRWFQRSSDVTRRSSCQSSQRRCCRKLTGLSH
eukprot:5547504-Karenia_brevis.AAC.1